LAKQEMSVEHGVLQLRALPLQPRRYRAAGDPGQRHDQTVVRLQSPQVVKAMQRRTGALCQSFGGGIQRRADDQGGGGIAQGGEGGDRRTAGGERLRIPRVQMTVQGIAQVG
jgi:hypothetical protein